MKMTINLSTEMKEEVEKILKSGHVELTEISFQTIHGVVSVYLCIPYFLE